MRGIIEHVKNMNFTAFSCQCIPLYIRTNAPDGWDDEVSSFVIRPGCELTGYENADKNGHMFSFAAGSYEAPKDDTMSSWICTC